MNLKYTTKLEQDDLVNLTESLINSLVERDSISNDILEGFLKDFATNFKANIEMDDVLLNDDIISLFLYAEKALKNIIREPKYKKVKVDKFIDKSRLKKTTPKTINWIGRQPGRTIREKMNNVDRVLSQVIVDTYDIKENQVTIFVLKSLYKVFKEKEEYLKKLDEKEKSRFLLAFKSLILEKEKSNISEARDIYHIIPNNTLIGHKNYSIVWKTMNKLLKVDSKRKIREYSLASRLVKGIYLTLVSKLASFESLTNVEEYLYIKDGMDHEELEDFEDKEKKFELEGDIYIKFLGRKDIKIPKIQFIVNKEAEVPKKLTVIQMAKQIRIEIEDIENIIIKNNNSAQKKVFTIKFDIDKFNSSRVENTLFVEASFNDKNRCNIGIKNKKNIIQLINRVVSEIEKTVNMELEKQVLKDAKAKEYGNISLDFIGNEPQVVLNGEKVAEKTSNSVVKYDNAKNLEKSFKTDKNSIYINHKGITYVKDIFEDYENNDNKNALGIYFDSIKREVEPKVKSLLLYNMPDSIEEVYQKPIKEIVNSRFNKNTFPIWRSVAAVTKAIKDNSIELEERKAIFVMDFNTSFVSTGIILMQKEKSLKEGYIIKHFQPFREEKDGLKVNEKNFMESYLKLYLDKYKVFQDKKLRAEFIEEVIKESAINKVFTHKMKINKIILSKSGVEGFIAIKYDEEIIKILLQEFEANFKKFIKIQKSKIKSFENRNKDKNIKFTYGIILCNTLNNILKKEINKVFNEVLENDIETKVYSSLEILEGSDVYHKRILNNKKTWIEHLPKLSLEVPRNYQYNRLTLVGRENQKAMDVMGQNNKIELKETLIIPKGKKEIKFPIIKEDISSNSKPIEILIKHKSFPLEKDEEVNVVIEYVYGKEDSYKISLYPVNENAAFEKIKVSLKSEEEDKEAKLAIPKIEKIISPEDIENRISVDGERKDNNNNLVREIKDNIFDFNYKISELKARNNGDLKVAYEKYYEKIAFIERIINRKSKRYVEMALSETELGDTYLNEMVKSDAFKYIKELTRISPRENVEKEFFEYIEKNQKCNGFYKKCMYYLFSTGKLTPKEISNEFLKNYENLYKNLDSNSGQGYWNKVKRQGLLQLLINNPDKKPFEILVKDILSGKYNYGEVITDLLRVCKADPKIIIKIFSVDGGYSGKQVIKEIIEFIKSDFDKYYMKLELNDDIRSFKNKEFYLKEDKLYINTRDTDKIMKYLEMIYVILTIRAIPSFEYLKPSSEESKLLARNIRAIDRHLELYGTWKNGDEKIYDSTMKFTGISKPESLKNVRDIVYAINLYLTGDNGANNITMNVGEIED